MEWCEPHSPNSAINYNGIRCFWLLGAVGQCGVADGFSWLGHSRRSEYQLPQKDWSIVVAVALWGPLWKGKQIQCLCDNIAVVYAVNKGSAHDPKLVRLLRILALLYAVHSISLRAEHLPGVNNTTADALSRNNLSTFFASNPQATPVPTGVALCLQELVLDHRLHWTSPNWKRLFNTTLSTALHLPPELRMPQLSVDTFHSGPRPE